jgi:hypothetical protein
MSDWYRALCRMRWDLTANVTGAPATQDLMLILLQEEIHRMMDQLREETS